MKLKPLIIFEDQHLLVINKPAGLVVHGDGKASFETLADIILKERPEMKEIGEPMIISKHGTKNTEQEEVYSGSLKTKDLRLETIIERPGIVHRLDKETSGVMVLAKTQNMFLHLKKAFKNRTIEKKYHAFTYGAIKNNEGVIEGSIGRSTSDIRKWAVGKGTRGELREAVTEYRVLARIGLKNGKEGGSTEAGTFSYIEAQPKTGRTHQIRVHLRSINHPILCDSLYAPHREGGLGFSRLALHAHSLTIPLPGGKSQTFEAPFPEDFQNARDIAGIANSKEKKNSK